MASAATVLKVASSLVVRHGPAALTVRDVAAAADCSTMMIYTWFGGKDALIEAVYGDGFARLAAALAAGTAQREPLARLRALAQAYRDFGLAHRTLYAAMFSQPLVTRRSQRTRVRDDTRSFTTLLDAVRAALAAGSFGATPRAGGNAEAIADAFWAAVHGHVSLEITGHFVDDPAVSRLRFQTLVDACIAGMAIPERSSR